MKRTYLYAAMTEDAAERRRWTFYEAVNKRLKISQLKPFPLPRQEPGFIQLQLFLISEKILFTSSSVYS
jgi:hypothetical protein